jgi:hypothetical protein
MSSIVLEPAVEENDVGYVDRLFSAITDDLVETFFSLLIESLELFPPFVPVIWETDADDDKDSNNDSDAFDPNYRGIPGTASGDEVLGEAEPERYYHTN